METAAQAAAEFVARRAREERRSYARRPKKIRDVLARVITRKGYGRFEASAALDAAWRQAAGESLAAASRAGPLRGRRLEIVVTNSTTMQELAFQKQHVLAELRKLMPDARIGDLRFRVGPIE